MEKPEEPFMFHILIMINNSNNINDKNAINNNNKKQH